MSDSDAAKVLKALRPLDDADLARLHALDRSLTNHTPTADGIDRIEAVRDWAKKLGFVIVQNCQDSRERSLALTHLEDAVMWSVKGIVLQDAAKDT